MLRHVTAEERNNFVDCLLGPKLQPGPFGLGSFPLHCFHPLLQLVGDLEAVAAVAYKELADQLDGSSEQLTHGPHLLIRNAQYFRSRCGRCRRRGD
jgi:hypothetical protein